MWSFMLEISCWRDDALWSGRPTEVDSDQIEILIENDQHYTTWEIAYILKITKSSTENHVHQLGYVNHFDVWVPYKLSKKQNKKPLLDHISICDYPLKCNKNVLFLKQIVTDDEKWILTIMWNIIHHGASEMNHHQPYQSLVFIQRKVMLCIWWNWTGVLYYETFWKSKRSIPIRAAPN